MVAQSSWDYGANFGQGSQGQLGIPDDDQWHVLMGPGEVKVLSLEQLDDFFRLDVIDENTLVWQDGMQDWAPLSMVAGLDEEQSQQPAVSDQPPPLAPAPHFSSAPAPTTQALAPSPPSLSASAPPPSVAPASSAPPASSIPAPSMAPPSSIAPASIAPSSSVASTSAAPVADSAFPPASPSDWASSLAPLQVPTRDEEEFSFKDSTSDSSLSRGNRLILAGAIVFGALLVMYRNDLLRDVSHSVGMGGAYDGFEAVFGPPGFGTPRSVAEETPAEEATPDPATDTGATMADTSETETAQAQAATGDSETSAEDESASAKDEGSKGSQAAAPPSSTKKVRSYSKPARPTTKAAPAKKLKGRNSEYDPMNAAL